MDETVLWSHELALSPVPGSASQARRFVASTLLERGLGHLTEDVRLVTSELATNAVQHARTPFVVQLQGRTRSVLLTVHDDSGLQPLAVHAAPSASHGRGLSLVEHVSQAWGVSPSGDGAKSVWASFSTAP